MKNIQTMEAFENASESWYQRTLSLRRYSEDETKEYIKRAKAAILFQIMLIRMKHLIMIKIQISKPKIPLKFESGGFIVQPTT